MELLLQLSDNVKSLPCTERIIYRRPYAIKNQRKAQNSPHVGGISHALKMEIFQHFEALDQ